MTITLSDVLQRLNKVKGPDHNGQYKALCPCHDDHNPSLSITEKDGKVLARCFACGAQLPDVLDALGFQRETVTAEQAFSPKQSAAQILEAEYIYADGALRKLKYRRADGSKFCMWQHKAGTNWVNGRKGIQPGLYQSQPDLPEVVFLVEGEKDVDSLKRAGYPAASLPDGSKSKWEKSYDATFSGKRILILPDNDEPGMKYAQMCAGKLYGNAEAVWILDLRQAWPEIPQKGDISDMIARFGADTAIQKVMELDKVISPWKPAEAPAEEKPGIMVTSAQDLQKADLPPVKFLVSGILPDGTSIVSAASKIGKSWMVLDMGLSIASGVQFLGRTTNQCGVLYLALEDSLGRLQDRMNKILDNKPAPAQFYFSTEVPTLDNGLLDALNDVLKAKTEIKLVIIDTLQKVRGRALPREGPYEQDYREMGMVKTFMDKMGVSVMFVHHNRKMKDEDDPFNMISGTNGIMGAADTAWAIIKSKRADQEATLHITGRDVPQSDTVITFDKSTWKWKWKSVGAADWINEQRAKLEYENSPIVRTIRQLLQESKEGQWSGTATELMNEGRRITKTVIAATPQKVGFTLKGMKSQLLDRDGIVHETTRHGNAGNKHHFYYQNLSWVDEAEQQEELPL